MRPLAPRERRILAVGLLVAAVALFWLVLVWPLAGGFFDRAERARQLTETYQRNERIISALPVWRVAGEAQRRDAMRFVIVAPAEASAVEALKERFQRIATDGGFAVTGVDGMQADAAPGTVRVRADFTPTLTQLNETLRRLENEGAYVAIDYLSISAGHSTAEGALGPLDVRLEFSADWRVGDARP
jgi:general secretion pathway protein M